MRTTQVQIVMPRHANGVQRLFGGQLMDWIDIVAAVEARRHAGSDVTLAAVDPLEFLAPVHVNDTVVIQAQVTWTGRTSLEVSVETFVERLDGVRDLVNRAYLVFVAVDEQGNPVPVQPYEPEEGEPDERQAAAHRHQLRMALREAAKQNISRTEKQSHILSEHAAFCTPLGDRQDGN
jgi:acyl-CoA hydrolase